MNSEFAELSHARYRSRTRRRRILILVGVLLILAGYALMAVSPETSTDWALARAMGGMACIAIGFALAVLPMLSSWTRGE
ncbi:MAG: hypothetical protein IPH54_08700 [Rhodoferax sp.]|jgi:uncharacterized membrane protein|nr:hypothetical protein [Rhodoferax sp.]